MTAEAILEHIAAAGGALTLTADGERIRAELPEDALGLLDLLREHKADVIRLLQEQRPAAPASATIPERVESSANVASAPADEPAPWRDHFSRWLAEHCISREGREDAAGIGCLHVDFCQWAVEYNGVPCSRGNFEALLRDAGFRLRDGMACGLVGRDDLAAHRDFAEYTAGVERKPSGARMDSRPADQFQPGRVM